MIVNTIFLVPYPIMQAPSQRFRFEQYFNFLKQKQISFDCYPFLDTNSWHNLYKDGNKFKKILSVVKGFIRRFWHLVLASKADYVFIHRELTPIGPPVFEWLIAKVLGKKIIYDFDDAIWMNDPNEHGILVFFKWKRKVRSICKWSYKVSCGNHFLASYANQYCENVVYIPTTIDTTNWHNKLKKHREKEVLTIGWTGTHTALYYLQEILPVIKKLVESEKFKFLVISNKKPELDFDFQFIKWNEQTEIEDLLKIDIGIMPLTDDEWSKGKCGFKALQYMSLGIPAIASPVGANNAIIEEGKSGLLPKSNREWEIRIKELSDDFELRKSIGLEGRKRVQKCYSVESNKENFLSLFS